MGRLFNRFPQKTFRQELRNNRPHPEVVLWGYLRQRKFHGLKFRRQQGIGKFVVDFYCPTLRLAIEIDGDSHFSDEAQRYDAARTQCLADYRIEVIRFRNDEVMHATDSVLARLHEKMRHCIALQQKNPYTITTSWRKLH